MITDQDVNDFSMELSRMDIVKGVGDSDYTHRRAVIRQLLRNVEFGLRGKPLRKKTFADVRGSVGLLFWFRVAMMILEWAPKAVEWLRNRREEKEGRDD